MQTIDYHHAIRQCGLPCLDEIAVLSRHVSVNLETTGNGTQRPRQVKYSRELWRNACLSHHTLDLRNRDR